MCVASNQDWSKTIHIPQYEYVGIPVVIAMLITCAKNLTIPILNEMFFEILLKTLTKSMADSLFCGMKDSEGFWSGIRLKLRIPTQVFEQKLLGTRC